MKLIARIKLQPTESQREALWRTLKTANTACNYVSGVAWERKVFGQFSLHRLCYRDIRRQFSLGADVAVRVFAKVADAYKLDRSTKRSFKIMAAFPFNDRLVSYKIIKREVSVWTTTGRQKMSFIISDHGARLLAGLRGHCDLLSRNGEFYLYQICDVEEEPESNPDDFIGVDLGVSNIAVDSTGKFYQGKTIKNVRYRQRRLRTRLQKKQTRSAKRLLQKLSGKERRFANNTNHTIAKQIVKAAHDTGRGIALENLKGIRDRATARGRQRVVLHSWSFFQLRRFIEYKSKLMGVPVILINPTNTSRTCPRCGCIDKSNRKTQDSFLCTDCGYSGRADYIAALNIRSVALLSVPNVAASC